MRLIFPLVLITKVVAMEFDKRKPEKNKSHSFWSKAAFPSNPSFIPEESYQRTRYSDKTTGYQTLGLKAVVHQSNVLTLFDRLLGHLRTQADKCNVFIDYKNEEGRVVKTASRHNIRLGVVQAALQNQSNQRALLEDGFHMFSVAVPENGIEVMLDDDKGICLYYYDDRDLLPLELILRRNGVAPRRAIRGLCSVRHQHVSTTESRELLDSFARSVGFYGDDPKNC